MRRGRAAAAFAVMAVAVACSPGTGGAAPATGAQLSIYAAASLRDALIAVKTVYEAAVPGTKITMATDSSATLRTQIEEGAPADVFLSADGEDAASLVAEGLVDGASVDFAGNRLTIVVPADNPGGIESPMDLARPGVKIVAAGDKVPITNYALHAVANLAQDPDYPTGFAEAYTTNIVSREENVKAVVAKIALGEGDAAIVYATDAMTATGVVAIEIPATANVHATYAGVVINSSPRLDAAHAFLDWLGGSEGAEILGTFGFLPPP